jgi:hypothetical protein
MLNGADESRACYHEEIEHFTVGKEYCNLNPCQHTLPAFLASILCHSLPASPATPSWLSVPKDSKPFAMTFFNIFGVPSGYQNVRHCFKHLDRHRGRSVDWLDKL